VLAHGVVLVLAWDLDDGRLDGIGWTLHGGRSLRPKMETGRLMSNRCPGKINLRSSA